MLASLLLRIVLLRTVDLQTSGGGEVELSFNCSLEGYH